MTFPKVELMETKDFSVCTHLELLMTFPKVELMETFSGSRILPALPLPYDFPKSRINGNSIRGVLVGYPHRISRLMTFPKVELMETFHDAGFKAVLFIYL